MKRIHKVALLYTLLALTGCAAEKPRINPASKDVVPRTFKAGIGGFLGNSCYVKLQNGVLIYETKSEDQKTSKTEISPPAEQWEEFQRSLDSLNVWCWQDRYPNPGVYDGTQWSLDIEYSDHLLHVTGDNSYPTASGRPNGNPDLTKTFENYLAAVQKLLGGKDFK